MLKGTVVNLWAVEPFDLPLIREWLLDPELVASSAISPYLSNSIELEHWYQRINNDLSIKAFAIKTKDGTHIGNIEISGIDFRASCGEAGLFLGDQQYIRKGYGRDALTTLLAFAFRELNLHRVFVRVISANKNAVAFFKSCGFTEEGRLRESYFSGGRYSDMIIMGILAHEFTFGGKID